MNTLLNDLYNKIYQNDENQHPLQFIVIVEPQIDEIVKNDLSSPLDFPKATKLLTDFGIHLANTGKFNKAILYFNIVAELFENDKRSKSKSIHNTPLYESILLYRGVSYYNTRKFKNARTDLKRLALTFPQNVKYKNWYNKTVNREIGLYQFVLLILLACTAIFYFYTKGSQGYLNSISYSVMVGCVVCAFIVDVIKRRRKIK